MSEPDIVYRRAREILEPILAGRGLALAAECHYPESFGSAQADYKRKGLRVQLIWDGKDRWLWMTYAALEGNRYPRSDEYQSLEPLNDAAATPSTVLREGEAAERRIASLAERLTVFLDRDRAV
jgi:hypothetical protein